MQSAEDACRVAAEVICSTFIISTVLIRGISTTDNIIIIMPSPLTLPLADGVLEALNGCETECYVGF